MPKPFIQDLYVFHDYYCSHIPNLFRTHKRAQNTIISTEDSLDSKEYNMNNEVRPKVHKYIYHLSSKPSEADKNEKISQEPRI
ncbi:Protein of unknown function [Gryllus bimaculatus]|nr:Protein of unknown function [Gryllus bimaculatus]